MPNTYIEMRTSTPRHNFAHTITTSQITVGVTFFSHDSTVGPHRMRGVPSVVVGVVIRCSRDGGLIAVRPGHLVGSTAHNSIGTIILTIVHSVRAKHVNTATRVGVSVHFGATEVVFNQTSE